MARMSVELQIETQDAVRMERVGAALAKALESVQRDLDCEARLVFSPAKGRLPYLLRKQGI